MIKKKQRRAYGTGLSGDNVVTDHEENRGKQSAEITAAGQPKCLTVAFSADFFLADSTRHHVAPRQP